MEEQFEKIFARVERVALTADEKSAGRTMLQSFMALRPIRTRKSLHVLGKHAAVFTTTLGFLLSAAGMSYAAEGSVPGDTLYPVKVKVNEEVRAALLTNSKDKAHWEAARAERRLAEAEALATRGKLKKEASAKLAVQFRGHAEKAQKQLAVLRTETNTDAADEVSTHLEVSLRAHGKILRGLDDDATSGTQKQSDDKKSLAAITAAVDTETTAVVDDRRRSEDTVLKERDHSRAQKNARMRHAAAERKIAEVRTFLASRRVRLESETLAQAEMQLGKADALVVQGDAKVSANDFGAAVILYLEAQRTAQEAKFFLQTEHRLKIKIDKKKENDAQFLGAHRPGRTSPSDGRSGNQKKEREVRIEAREEALKERESSHEERVKVKVDLEISGPL